MEVHPLSIPDAEDGTEQFAAALSVQRRRVREFLAAQQERLRRAETELSQQLQRIGAELADDRRETRRTQEELAQRSTQLQQQADAIERMKADLAARQAEWEKLYNSVIDQQQSFAGQLKLQQDEFARRQQDFLQQQTAAVAAETELISERKEIEAGRAELEIRRIEITALRDSLQTRQAELDKREQEQSARTVDTENLRTEISTLRDTLQTRQAELDKREQDQNARAADTETRRRRIAHELKAQHAANLKQIELKRLALEQEAKADHSELQRQLESLQEECRKLKDKPSPAENSVDRREVERIEAENNELSAHLADLEGQLAQTRQELADARANRGEDDEEDEDGEDGDSLRRRYEMSIDDLRELKAQNEELQEQLARARQGGGGNAGQISAGVLNWETEKMRILAALEADFEEEKEEDREEKIKIQEVIRKTDRIVAEKNKEIGELRGLLESKTDNIGSMAVGAAALGQILDNDALIQEERNNLAHLQEECRDKLRQAEIEISLERAKIARERSQLDEKLHILEQQGINLTSVNEEKQTAKQPRGRWLARLGLTGSEDEKDK
jgi:chromosome segregation ATPase